MNSKTKERCQDCNGLGGDRWHEADGSENGERCATCNGSGVTTGAVYQYRLTRPDGRKTVWRECDLETFEDVKRHPQRYEHVSLRVLYEMPQGTAVESASQATSAKLPFEWNETAARSAANKVISKLDRQKCDSQAVSDCLRCGAIYLARRTLALLDAQEDADVTVRGPDDQHPMWWFAAHWNGQHFVTYDPIGPLGGPAQDGCVMVPVRLPALAVSEIKDLLQIEYGLHEAKARPLWAELLQIVTGMSIEEQEKINDERAALAQGGAA